MIRKIKRAVKACIKLVQHRPITAEISIVEPQKLLAGKNALITGGTSGIGKAIAVEFFKAGAFVIITSRSGKKADEIARTIDASGKKVVGMELDTCKVATFELALSKIKSIVPDGRIDILVNNAGIIGGGICSATEEIFNNVINTNLRGSFFLSKIIASDMIRNGIKGNILNLASSSSLRPAMSAYTLSKWGIRGLTLGLAKSLAPHGIVVNGIAPGPTATPMLGKEDYSDISHPKLASGRYAIPDEIAAMALFLAGPQGRTIIGDIVYMTGGAGLIDYNDIDYTFIV